MHSECPVIQYFHYEGSLNHHAALIYSTADLRIDKSWYGRMYRLSFLFIEGEPFSIALRLVQGRDCIAICI